MWKGDMGRATVTKANNSSPNGAGGVQLDDIKGWIGTAPNRQGLIDSGRQSQMYVNTIFYALKAVKVKTLLSKPTFKLSKLAKCENMIWHKRPSEGWPWCQVKEKCCLFSHELVKHNPVCNNRVDFTKRCFYWRHCSQETSHFSKHSHLPCERVFLLYTVWILYPQGHTEREEEFIVFKAPLLVYCVNYMCKTGAISLSDMTVWPNGMCLEYMMDLMYQWRHLCCFCNMMQLKSANL